MLPNLIIAGVNKAGTTSLFTYLSRHPDIESSSVKETCYFLPLRYGEEMPPLEEYTRHFRHITSSPIVMEATPGYFYGGERVIEGILEIMPDTRIVILLRNPAERLISHFNYMKSMLLIDKEMTLKGYIKRCLDMDSDALNLRRNDPYFGVEGGYYEKYVNSWIESFGDRVKFLFFDDLNEAPASMLTDLCDWLGIDGSYYKDYTFTVENRTAQYKNRSLHKAALFVNMKLEPFFRKNQRIKNALRDLYAHFNQKSSRTITAAERDQAQELYMTSNRKLAALLKCHGVTEFPKWLDHE